MSGTATSSQSPATPAIAIVGLGPRGISLIERIAASLDGETALTLHLIDDAQHGAGRVWDTEQTRTLCMNTLSAAVTLFTEPGSTISAPALEGPILHEWIRLLRGDRLGISPAKTALFDAHPPAQEVADSFAEELAVTVPESNPSRALYGAYLRWVYDLAISQLPASVTVESHHARVIAITEESGRDRLSLSDGTSLIADTSVLAYGWQTPAPSPSEASLLDAVSAANLTWIRPNNPVEQPLHLVPESGTVLTRGLGMGFFDVMALLTFDRGGQFLPDPDSRSGLLYEPSGREPHLVVTSHRGYPYLPKSEFHALPPAAQLTRLKSVIASLSTRTGPASIDFDTEVWPAIIADAYEAYYRVLNRLRPESILTSFETIVEKLDSGEFYTFDHDTTEPFDLDRWLDPLRGFSGTIDQVTSQIADSMATDIREAAAGLDSPTKAALWSISASRKPSSILGSEGRYTLESRRNLFATMMSLGQMVGSGPPLFRTRQLLALIDAGLISFLGSDPTLRADLDTFTFIASSPTTGNTEVHSTTLIDAWMHQPDIRRPADPLALSLASAGRVRSFHDHTRDHQHVATGSPEVDPNTRLLVRPDGSLDPRLHVIGIPTWAQLPDTTISPMPGTDSLMLQETDTAARSALDIALSVDHATLAAPRP